MVLDDFTMFNSICNFAANETVRVCMQKDLITYRIGLSCYKVIQHRNRLIQSNSSMPTKLSIWASPTVFSSKLFWSMYLHKMYFKCCNCILYTAPYSLYSGSWFHIPITLLFSLFLNIFQLNLSPLLLVLDYPI